MRKLAAAVALGSLLCTGPALAMPNASASGASTSEHSAYLEKVKRDMAEWGRKLDALGTNAATKGQEGSSAAKRELELAWGKTKAASQKLSHATGDGWDSAKASFETASRRLADAWQRFETSVR